MHAVVFASFGALLWNTYLSYAALQQPVDCPKKIEKNEIEAPRERLEGITVASPMRKFLPRRSLDRVPADLDLSMSPAHRI